MQKPTNLCASPVALNLNACIKCGFLAELLQNSLGGFSINPHLLKFSI
jgi:hypothetical protein